MAAAHTDTLAPCRQFPLCNKFFCVLADCKRQIILQESSSSCSINLMAVWVEVSGITMFVLMRTNKSISRHMSWGSHDYELIPLEEEVM